MRADTPDLVPRPAVPMASQSAPWLVAIAALAAWTVVVALLRFDPAHAPVGASAKSLVVFGPPVALAALLLFDARAAALPPLRLALGWTVLVAAVELAANRVAAGDTKLLALPALGVAAVVLSRRPVLAVGAAFAISGSYGALIAFFHFPEEKVIQLIFGALAVGLLWRTFLGRRTYGLKLSIGLGVMLVYVYVTLVQTILDAPNNAAVLGFMTSAWFMVAVPVIAFAGWPRSVHDRLAKALLVIAAAVGAYAVYRWVAGISVTEYQAFGGTPFNYVGGTLRLLGSFPTGQDLGGWTAIVVPFCIAIALTLDARWRVIGLAAAALCSIGLVGSQLRVALVAVALGALTVIVLHEAARGFAGLRLGTTATAVLAMVAIGVSAFSITGGSTDNVTHSYSSLLNPSSNDPSVNERLYKWRTAIRDLRAHPFGYGMGTANARSSGRLRKVESIGQFDVDNGYLRVALEQGFAIMILFGLAVLGLAAELARRGLTLRTRAAAGMAIGAAGAMVSFAVLLSAGAFQDGPRALPVWIIAGLGLAQFTTTRAGEDDADASRLGG